MKSGPRAVEKPVRPTLADIARMVEVSEATVSRALRGHPAISEQMRGLIGRVARDLGYVPNAAARSLARQPNRTLGLIVPDVTDPVHGLIVAAFGRAAYARGYTVILLDGARDPARREAGLLTLRAHQVPGVAFCSAPVSAREMTELLRPTQVVFIMPEGADAEVPTDTPLGRLRADDARGIGLLVEHLCATGRQRLSYVNGIDTVSNRVRRKAVLEALQGRGIEPRIREYTAASADPAGAEEVARLVAHERPDALICYDDKMALRLLDALRSLGVRVPEEVAVTGFDGVPYAAISNPRLTTVAQPADRLGEIAAELLCLAIETGAAPPDVLLPVDLMVRESSTRG